MRHGGWSVTWSCSSRLFAMVLIAKQLKNSAVWGGAQSAAIIFIAPKTLYVTEKPGIVQLILTIGIVTLDYLILSN